MSPECQMSPEYMGSSKLISGHSLFLSLTNEEMIIIYQIDVTKLISTHSFYDEANK